MNEQSSNAESSVKESFAQAKDEVRATAGQAKATIKTKTKDLMAQATEYGGEYVQHGKERAASRIGGFSESMRQTADRFEQEKDPNIAQYTRLIADKLDNAATYVREHDLSEVRRDAENLARQYPGLFFGGLFVAGLVASRFLKASAQIEEVADESDLGNNFGAEWSAVAANETAPVQQGY